MSFKDHFSKQAADYARFRPRYPRELFEYLGGVAPSRALAWDCATGNGQAAVALAEVFERVIATDASEKQIANAQPLERDENQRRTRSVGLQFVNDRTGDRQGRESLLLRRGGAFLAPRAQAR